MSERKINMSTKHFHLTIDDMLGIIKLHNEHYHVDRQYGDKNALRCIIVFKSENWPSKNYSLKSRSYAFRSDEKYFVHSCLGSSIFANSLDGIDQGVRLDWYLSEWKIDYCYFEKLN